MSFVYESAGSIFAGRLRPCHHPVFFSSSWSSFFSGSPFAPTLRWGWVLKRCVGFRSKSHFGFVPYQLVPVVRSFREHFRRFSNSDFCGVFNSSRRHASRIHGKEGSQRNLEATKSKKKFILHSRNKFDAFLLKF